MYSRSIVCSVIDEGCVEMFLHGFAVGSSNSHIRVTVSVGFPLVNVELFNFVVNQVFQVGLGDRAGSDVFACCAKFSHFIRLFISPEPPMGGDPSDLHFVIGCYPVNSCEAISSSFEG